MPTSCPAIPYYSSSLYILGIYALRVTQLCARRRAFKWFAASAERKCIFESEKSMNPEFLACFSWFHNFLNFQWFWGGLAINFNCSAQFPAQGCLQIALSLNFMSIQIFLFILCSCDCQCNVLFRFKKWSPGDGSRTGGSAISISIWENYGRVSWMVKSFVYLKTRLDSDKMSADAKIKPSPQAPAYYSYEHTLSC